ncbi:MAG: HesA/MoeB/ThiF family protein [Dehalococcoidales bacterium]|nr:HesA/MoeB/ThiF family protein [Dehalococcoidales bacterium]
MLTRDELTRYKRQLAIFGEEGQLKLKQARVFLAGAGGLGSTIATYLTVAGIGRLKIVDNDVVSLDNLNRQILYGDGDLGRGKTESAAARLKSLNANIQVETVPETIAEDNAAELTAGCDLIIDGLDNFETRYILNRVALAKKTPFFHGAIHGFYGQATTIVPGKTACLRCIFPEAPPTVAPPVVGVTAGVIGCIQATEVIKYLLGAGELLENRLLVWDGLGCRLNEVPLKRTPDCKDCG